MGAASGRYDPSVIEALPRKGRRPVRPGALAAHTQDHGSRGLVVSSDGACVVVLWGRAPWFETMQVKSTTIKATSRKLKVGWRCEEADGPSIVGDWAGLVQRMVQDASAPTGST